MNLTEADRRLLKEHKIRWEMEEFPRDKKPELFIRNLALAIRVGHRVRRAEARAG